jgi:ABC-2 type transport system ATP-binding protein
MAQSTIAFANVYKRYGNAEVVSDVTLHIKPGEVVGFVGPNGAGKTTTIAMLMGFISPTKGAIRLRGSNVTPENAHQFHGLIGYVAGDMSLPGNLTGQQYLAFCGKQNGFDRKRYELLVHQLSPILDKLIKQLSRGNKQKLALLAALMHDPEILILDEPTSGLDPLMQEVFLATITREAKRGVTVLMSSHILSEVSSVCSRIVFMKTGKLVVDKPISDITKQLGKHITISSTNTKPLVKFLPEGTSVISDDGRQLVISIDSQTVKQFMRWIITKSFDDIQIKDRDLDDIFHELYQTEASEVAP